MIKLHNPGMQNKYSYLVAFFVCSFLLSLGSLHAEPSADSYSSAFCAYDETSKLMNCDYQYEESSPVKSLTLKVDGKEIQIPNDGVSRYPAPNQKTAILFLIDISDPGRSLTVAGKNIPDILQILSTRKAYQKVGIATFDSNFELIHPIDDDTKGAINALVTVRAKGQATEFYKSILEAISVLKNTNSTRKVLVVLSDGKDEDRAYKFEDVVKAANQAKVQILALGYAEKASDAPYLQNLKRLADETHGKFINVSTGKLTSEFIENPFKFAESGGRIAFNAEPFYLQRNITIGLISDKEKLADIETVANFPDGRSFFQKTIDWMLKYWPFTILFLIVITSIFLIIKKFKKDKPKPFATIDAMDGSGTIYYLDKDATRIGRGDDNEITFNNNSISTHHAEIHKRREGDVFIVDLASTNGVYLNEDKVTKATLKDGDLIELGDVRLRFNMIYQ